ncbi:MAG: hypothetical protein M4579_001024 [Chaenotheca gracillima]|nr:MAG: hypothetical protein M4579_001024 [Chaenotheca gracillima]
MSGLQEKGNLAPASLMGEFNLVDGKRFDRRMEIREDQKSSETILLGKDSKRKKGKAMAREEEKGK